MKFRTAYPEKEHFYTPHGSRYRQKYVKSYDKDGTSILKKDGLEDVYDSIQKAADGRTIEDLVRRARAGDTSAIGEVTPQPFDIDLTHMPKDLLEAHTMLRDAKDKYLSLPSELRGKFGNSFDQFLKASADGSAVNLLKTAKDPNAPQPLSADEISKFRSMIKGGSN